LTITDPGYILNLLAQIRKLKFLAQVAWPEQRLQLAHIPPTGALAFQGALSGLEIRRFFFLSQRRPPTSFVRASPRQKYLSWYRPHLYFS
jgi:hypothetical protein